MHSYSHVRTACKGGNVALTKRWYFWALICTHSMHFFRMDGKLAKMWSYFTQKNGVQKSREDLLSRNLFSNFMPKFSDNGGSDLALSPPPKSCRCAWAAYADITEICGAITQEMCTSACRSRYDRLLRCSANNVGYIV